MVPHALLRDASLSALAVRLYGVLDGRQGEHRSQRVRRKTLAADLDVSTRTVQRVELELITAGWLLVTKTGRATIYDVINPERRRSRLSTPSGHARPVRVDMGVHSTKQELPEKELLASKQGAARPNPAPTTSTPAAAAPVGEGLADNLTVEDFLSRTPVERRPTATTAIARHLHDALDVMSLDELLSRIAADITGDMGTKRNAAGLTVNRLSNWRSLAPVADSRPRPQRPQWCGDCDELSRMMNADETGLTVRRCVICHPFYADSIKQQQPVVMAVTA
jgi:hypothetical protein